MKVSPESIFRISENIFRKQVSGIYICGRYRNIQFYAIYKDKEYFLRRFICWHVACGSLSRGVAPWSLAGALLFPSAAAQQQRCGLVLT